MQSPANSMANEIRNTVFLSTFFGQKYEDASEKVGSARLQEPRDLYSAASLQHPPKWPIECQVIPEKVKHIDVSPVKLEPFYLTNNTEPQPKPVGEEMGTIIYDYQPKLSVDYFCRSCVGGSEELQCFENTDPNSLKFESRFESGNLARAIKVTSVYYELYLRPDMYTDRHAQWYYFRIQNTKENVLYRFSIVNLNKPDSLYRYGMKPLVYSEKESRLNKTGWTRRGQNISYYKNDLGSEESASSYTLTFNLKFRHNNDTVYIAQCYPYTYSKLQSYLHEIESDKLKAQFCQQRLLCKSLAGNNVYVLTITSTENDEDECKEKKPVVVLSARVHPGETPASFMMKGIIDFLISSSSQAQELRDRFIFKLIPMLNPDGVIVGNSRCCLLGQDLNRQYSTVLREAFPQIYHTKVLLRRLAEENGVFMYCDIHGHSRRNNVFIYGCENRRIPEKKLTEQVFPLMMHKNAADKFSFQNCKFKIQKSKEGTGRIFAWTLGIGNSYTLEISLCGSTMASRQHTHFSTADYEGMGRHFCETLMDFSDNDPAKEKIREKILRKLLEGGSTAEEPVNIPITDYSSLSHSETDESDTTEDDEEEEAIKTKASIKRQKSVRQKKAMKRVSLMRPERASLSMSTASVEFTRGRSKKQVKYTTTEESMEAMQEKEQSMAKVLTSFRRSRLLAIQERQDKYAALLSPKKYTRLLFDDPFNPPSGPLLCTATEPEETADTGTQTEDECDYSDSAMKNEIYLSNACNANQDLAVGLQSLKISETTKKASTTIISASISNSRSKSKFESELDEKRKPLNGAVSGRRASNPSERRGSLVSSGIGKSKLSKAKESKSQEGLDTKPKRTHPLSKSRNQKLESGTLNQSHRESGRRVSWAGGFNQPSTMTVSITKKSSSSTLVCAKVLPTTSSTVSSLEKSKSFSTKQDLEQRSSNATTRSNSAKKQKRKIQSTRSQGTRK